MNTTLRVFIGSAGFLMLATAPVNAQSTKERVQMLEQRLDRLERIVTNNDSETELLRRIQTLQAENKALRNEVETLQFETQRSADRQRELYMDLDGRIQALESGGSAASAASGATGNGGSTGLAGSDRDDYQAAFELLKQGRYEEAATGFSSFLTNYPDSELRDNAEYWLAETHYVTEDFQAALAGFQSVITEYPSSRKLADAWLKVGYCNYEMSNWDEARQALNITRSRYSESTAARLAAQRLQLMDSEGH